MLNVFTWSDKDFLLLFKKLVKLKFSIYNIIKIIICINNMLDDTWVKAVSFTCYDDFDVEILINTLVLMQNSLDYSLLPIFQLDQ